VAHEGDVTSDVCLLENGLIQYYCTFNALYGFDCKEAKVFLVFPHMVTAMDKRATALTRVDGRWKLEVEFQMLANWTQTATAEGLGEFTADQVGANYYKNLFLKLKYNGWKWLVMAPALAMGFIKVPEIGLLPQHRDGQLHVLNRKFLFN